MIIDMSHCSSIKERCTGIPAQLLWTVLFTITRCTFSKVLVWTSKLFTQLSGNPGHIHNCLQTWLLHSKLDKSASKGHFRLRTNRACNTSVCTNWSAQSWHEGFWRLQLMHTSLPWIFCTGLIVQRWHLLNKFGKMMQKCIPRNWFWSPTPRTDPPYTPPCSQRCFNFSFVFNFGQRFWKHEWSFLLMWCAVTLSMYKSAKSCNVNVVQSLALT